MLHTKLQGIVDSRTCGSRRHNFEIFWAIERFEGWWYRKDMDIVKIFPNLLVRRGIKRLMKTKQECYMHESCKELQECLSQRVITYY